MILSGQGVKDANRYGLGLWKIAALPRGELRAATHIQFIWQMYVDRQTLERDKLAKLTTFSKNMRKQKIMPVTSQRPSQSPRSSSSSPETTVPLLAALAPQAIGDALMPRLTDWMQHEVVGPLNQRMASLEASVNEIKQSMAKGVHLPAGESATTASGDKAVNDVGITSGSSMPAVNVLPVPVVALGAIGAGSPSHSSTLGEGSNASKMASHRLTRSQERMQSNRSQRQAPPQAGARQVDSPRPNTIPE
mmetsp:Transcript_15468/g.31066  ORF Transcript_15468/g.31066 Transcript_15468/m.31066 type:complete len:249 (-) Transcript_15468:179-925(-)